MKAAENLICYALCYFWEVHCIVILSLCDTFDVITFYSHQEVVVSPILKARFGGKIIYYLVCMHSRHS